MAFSEIKSKKIERTVGDLCKRRSPLDLKDKVRVEYSVRGQEVLIYEARPRWNNPMEWIESGVAKLKYSRKANLWQLYWQRANMKWVKYEPAAPHSDLEELVAEVDRDRYGCFFG